MSPTSSVIGPIDWANWYVLKTLYFSLKDQREDKNGLSYKERHSAYLEIKRQFANSI